MPTVANGQTLNISSGQSVNGVLVLGGGTLNVQSGGSINGTTLASQGSEYIYVGGAASGTLIQGGFEFNYGSSINAIVDAGVQVAYGATTGTVLSGSGLQQVFTGGTAGSTVVDSGGEQMVGFGGTSVGTIVNTGGIQSINFTGVAHNTTVNSGGSESIGNGGTAIDTTIMSGGSVDLADGSLGGSVVDDGTLTFSAGGTFSGQLSGGGSLVVSSGAMLLGGANSFAGSISISEGTLELGVANAAGTATIGFSGGDGTLQVDGTLMPTNTIVGLALGDVIDLAGIAFDNAGTVHLAAGNLLQISENGHLYQLQLDSSASFSGAAFAIFADPASGTYVTLGQQPVSGALTINSGQSAANLLILSTGSLIIASGGTASGTMIEPGGSAVIDVGGSATSTTINGPGIETVFGSASGTMLLKGGEQDVYGTANNTVVDPDGIQQIFSGGAANGATINDNGWQIVAAGGIATATIVNQDGFQYVQRGGTANGSVLMSGGWESVASGGAAGNTVIEGGTLDLAAGAIASGTIIFLGTGGTLRIEDTVVSSSTFGAVTRSFGQGDFIDFSAVAFASGGSVRLLAGNILQVIENAAAYSLQLDPGGNFSGLSFRLGSDGGTGTKVSIETAPVVTAFDFTATHNQNIAATSLFSASDVDSDVITAYQLWDSVGGTGHWVVGGAAQPAGQTIGATSAQLAGASFQSGSGSDHLWVRASEGITWGAWQGFYVNAPLDHAPMVTAADYTASHGLNIAASSLFSASDADNDPIKAYQFWDSTPDPSSGHFVVGGVAQGTIQNIDVTAAQFASATFQSGSGSDHVWVRANDGITWGAWTGFFINAPIDMGPVATASDFTATHNQNIAATSLFSASDADSDVITAYQLWDSVGGTGHRVVGGAAQPAGQTIDATSAQLAGASFQSGSGSDHLWVRASDGITWGAWQDFYVNAPLDHASMVTAADYTASHGLNIAASSLFSVSDADNDPITAYQFWDSTPDPSSGSWIVGGVAQSAGQAINVSAAQFSNATFQSGAGSDHLWVRAFDGTLWSDWVSFNVNAPVDHSPVVSGTDGSLTFNSSVAVSSLFSVTDTDSDAMKTYELWDSANPASSGHFLLSGAVQPAGQGIFVDASLFNQASFAASSTPATDRIWERAFDGMLWSDWAAVNVTSHA